jgi:hypothetical protein
MKKTISIQLSIISLINFLFFSCTFINDPKDFKVKKWTPTLAAPLIDAKLTLQNMLKSQDIQPIISEDASGFLNLVYQDTIFSEFIENYIVLPNQTYSDEFKMPDSNIPAFDVQLAYRDSLKNVVPFNAGSIDRSLDFISFKSGQLEINFNSSYNQNVDLVLTIPFLRHRVNNQPLVETFTMGPNTSVSRTINLGNYDLDLTRNNQLPKGLEYKIEYTIRKISNNPVLPSAKINSSITINNPKYRLLKGYLGTLDITLPISKVAIEIFKNSFQGDIFFQDPKLILHVDNSIGAEILVSIPPLKTFYNDRTIVPRTLTRNNGFFLDTTLAKPANVGQSAVTKIFYSVANSNIRNAFNPSPVMVEYSSNIKINPNSFPEQNFVTDQSRIRVRADVELPLYGRINNLVISDTIPIKVDNDFQKDYNLEYIIYKLNTENGFPFDCKLQAYFLDSTKTLIDSIIVTPNFLLLPSARINAATGRVTQPTKEFYMRKFEGTRLRNVIKAKYIVLYGKFNTTNVHSNQNIKIYKDYFVNAKLAAETKVNVQIDN